MMTSPHFQAFECTNLDCRLRFSTDLSVDNFEYCPHCQSQMVKVGDAYLNYQPRSSRATDNPREILLVLDNLRSTLNVGSIFRTADGAGVKHIFCCGTTPTPEHPKIKKTSLGAESLTGWSYVPNAVQLILDRKALGDLILSLETTPESISLFEISAKFDAQEHPIVLVVGNEISGIDPGILEISDFILSIPMIGKKTSLNVAVSTGIALYTLRNQLINSPIQFEGNGV